MQNPPPETPTLADITRFYDMLPFPVGIKNQDLHYVGANTHTAKLTGFKHPNDMLGIIDSELRCPAAELAASFTAQDMHTLQGNELTNLDICRYRDDHLEIFLSTKKRIIIADEPHVFFAMVALPLHQLNHVMNTLNETSMTPIPVSGSFSTHYPDIIDSQQQRRTLTQRQAECLHFLIRGHSAKGIAYRLGISLRTAQEHLTNLKEIFSCYSKSQLVEKAFNLGFASSIPLSLLNPHHTR